MKVFILTLFFLILPISINADVKLFLFPKVILQSRDLYLKDIARIESSEDFKHKFDELKIANHYFKDGYIDSREIARVLTKNSISNYLVFGNTVHILDKSYAIKKEEQKIITKVKKGDTVTVVVKRKSISIEMIGVTLVDARVGDMVFVELNKHKKLRGLLKTSKVVEVNL